MKPISNPSGYATRQPAPDLGPLFATGSGVDCAQHPSGLSVNRLPTPSSCPELREVPITSGSPLPQSVDVSAAHAEGKMKRILRYLELNHTATLDEMAYAFGLPQNAFSGRISDLKRDMYIRWTGQTRPSRSRCSCDVYEITDAGRSYLQSLKSRMGGTP